MIINIVGPGDLRLVYNRISRFILPTRRALSMIAFKKDQRVVHLGVCTAPGFPNLVEYLRP